MPIRFIDEQPQKNRIRFIDDDIETQPAESTQRAQVAQPDQRGLYDKLAGPLLGAGGLIAKKKIEEVTPQQLAQLAGYGEDPKKSMEYLARGAQMVGQAALPLASGYTTTPLTELAVQKLRGEKTSEALKQAGIAGGLDLAVTGLGTLAGKTAKYLYPRIAKTLAGIPTEATEIALKQEQLGKSIFKGKISDKNVYTKLGKNVKKGYDEILNKNKKIYSKIGDKAQAAVNYLEKKTGKVVGAEKKALRLSKDKFNFTDISRDIDDMVALKQFGRATTLPSKDYKTIKEISNQIAKLSEGKGMSPGELYAINKNISNMIKFDLSKVPDIGTEGSGILKEARKLIRERLGEISPGYDKAAKKYATARTLRDRLRKKIGDETAGNKLKTIVRKSSKNLDETIDHLPELEELDNLVPKKYKFMDELNKTMAMQEDITPRTLLKGDPAEVGGNIKNVIEKAFANPEVIRNEPALKNLDKILPKKYKFMNKIEKDVARQQFESFIPKKGVLHNIRLAGALGLGGAGVYSGNPKLLAAAAALGGAGAPKTYKGLLRGGVGLKKAMSTPAARGATKQTVTRIADLLRARNK